MNLAAPLTNDATQSSASKQKIWGWPFVSNPDCQSVEMRQIRGFSLADLAK